jgi:hypothetical protein
MAITINVATILTGDCFMHRTLVVKKIVHALVALTVLLCGHLLLPKIVAQDIPAAEDIIWRLPAPDNNHFNFVYYLDEARFLVVNSGSVDIRSTVDGALIKSAPLVHTTYIYMNEAKTQFTTAYAGIGYLWDVESLSRLDTFTVPGRNIFSVIASESGRFIAGYSDGDNIHSHIWDRETGEEIYMNENLSSSNWGYDMAFSGDTLLAFAEDNTYFMDLRTMKKTYVNVKGKYTFSPDGKKMAFFIPQSGTLTENYFRILDVPTKEVTEQAITHNREPRTITFTKDSRALFFDRLSILHKIDISKLEIIGTLRYAKNFGISPQETELITIGIDSSLNKYLYKLRMNLVTSVEDNPIPKVFSITPNVVNEFATIILQSQPNDEVRIALYSVGGEMVDILPVLHPSSSSTMEVPFNLIEYPHLADGQYFLELTINGQPTQTIPFIIQR